MVQRAIIATAAAADNGVCRLILGFAIAFAITFGYLFSSCPPFQTGRFSTVTLPRTSAGRWLSSAAEEKADGLIGHFSSGNNAKARFGDAAGNRTSSQTQN